MSPEEICRGLGEAKTKGMFHELSSDGMKKVMKEAKLPTQRLASHTSTKKRNEDWSSRVWRQIQERAATGPAATLLFEWLTRNRRPMLADFLSPLGVPNDNGLTDADFMQEKEPEKLCEVAKALLKKYDKAEVAAYLLFLDASNKSEIFAELGLDSHLAGKKSAA
jgi:hypothetical protein